MFSGIIEGTARVRQLLPRAQGRRLWVEGLPDGLAAGQSVALNGVCLTVAELREAGAGFDLAGETLARSNLGRLQAEDLLNYERALPLGGRLDGHLVQGHVDGVGVVRAFDAAADDWWLEIEAAPELLALCVPKGSIAVDGISLTIARLDPAGFACTIVPHTRRVTNLAQRRVGAWVNLETDLIGKYVQRLLQPLRASGSPS
jgi:riboflavin synthase